MRLSSMAWCVLLKMHLLKFIEHDTTMLISYVIWES